MRIVPVKSKKQINTFHKLLFKIYANEPKYIMPLKQDIESVFSKEKNRKFKQGGVVERWLLEDDNGEAIGRVAAFIDKSKADSFDQPTGGMGFFECINDQAAANLLFDTCKDWLVEREMEAMDGPINFGERDAWWGMLAEGHHLEATYRMNYHPKYYRALIENYGFQVYFKQYSYGLDINDPRPIKYQERADRINADPDYTFKHVDKNNVEKAAMDFLTVYNAAWGSHLSFKAMRKATAMKLMASIKPVLVDYLMWFGYYKDEPVAMYLNMPELNQYFKYCNGNLNWLGKVKFFLAKTFKKTRTFYGFIFGIVPDHQSKGVEGALIMAANNTIVPTKNWDYTELIWIGDFNPKIMRVAETLGCDIVKTHHTYRYLFDRNKEFKRQPILE